MCHLLNVSAFPMQSLSNTTKRQPFQGAICSVIASCRKSGRTQDSSSFILQSLDNFVLSSKMSQNSSPRPPFFPPAPKYTRLNPLPSPTSLDTDSGYLADDELTDESILVAENQLCALGRTWWAVFVEWLRNLCRRSEG
jgi:hypothetical protein